MSYISHSVNPANVSVDEACSIAMEFIRSYVERGDNVAWIMQTQMGAIKKDAHVQIGGSCVLWGTRYEFNRHKVVVTQLYGTACLLLFDIHELIERIKQPIQQQSLW